MSKHAIEINPNSLSPTALAAVRYICTAFGTYLVSRGLVANDALQPLIGAFVVVLSTAIGVVTTWHGNEQKKRMEPYVPNAVATLKDGSSATLKSPPFAVIATLCAVLLLMSACTHGKFDHDKAVAFTRTSYAAARTAALACIELHVKYCVAHEARIRAIIVRGDDLDKRLAEGAGDQVSLDLLATTGELRPFAPE